MSSPIVRVQSREVCTCSVLLSCYVLRKPMGIIIEAPKGSGGMNSPIQQVAKEGHPDVLDSGKICYVQWRGPTFGNKFGPLAPKPMMDSSHGLREGLSFWEG